MDKLLNESRTKAIMLLILAVVLAGFSLGQAQAAKILRIAFDAADVKSLDPGFSFGTQDHASHDMIYDALLRFKPGDLTVIEPDIAERYEVSKDGMELTFYLRKGVMTHPFEGYPEGYEFTAEDVVFSLQKSANPRLSTYSGEFKNYDAEAIDRYTVRVRLKSRIPTPERAFVDYRGGQMVPKKAFETIGPDRFKTQPVGSGPFRVVKYIPGQKVIMEAHKKYWRGKPRLDGVELLPIADHNSREFALRRGEADVIEGVSEQPWVDKMRKLPNIVVDVFGLGETAHLSFDVSKKPFDNPLVRKAMLYATSRQELIAFRGPDVTDEACSIIPPAFPGGLSCEEVAKAGLLYKADLNKAKELLAQAGYPKGFSMEQTISERSQYRRPTENLQAQWRRVGVDVKLSVVDHPTYHTRIRQAVNPYTLYVCMRNGADQWLTYFFHSDSIVVTGKSPITNFARTNIIDDPIVEARNETDKAKQVQLWKQAQLKLLENAVGFALYTEKYVFARGSQVKWGHELKTTLTNYPQITELTDLMK